MNTLNVLGGADIGGSCYLAELEGVRILFDCGVRLNTPYSDHPAIPSPETIDLIFLSHAHLDHIGALAYTAAVCRNARIFATPTTCDFIRYQLSETIAEYIGADTDELRFSNHLLCQLVLNRIETAEFHEKTEIHLTSPDGSQEANVKFSFFPAGHIPGAAAVYLRIGQRSLLYSGDFYLRPTPLTDPCSLPEGLHPDILLLCGTYANRIQTDKSAPTIASIKENFSCLFRQNRNILVRCSQLTKGLEMLAMIDDLVREGNLPRIPVFIDEGLWQLARHYERTSDFRLPSYMNPLSERKVRNGNREIVFLSQSAAAKTKEFASYTPIDTNFSLHADGQELISYVRTLRPRKVFVVHAAPRGAENAPLAAALLNDRICVTYTENERIYSL
ncbi:MAG: MBL fold metallo-hydrolase [Clostridia bacterium]|nr:MBL fold metallo-hydrolase [Clostridia bacterium]